MEGDNLSYVSHPPRRLTNTPTSGWCACALAARYIRLLPGERVCADRARDRRSVGEKYVSFSRPGAPFCSPLPHPAPLGKIPTSVDNGIYFRTETRHLQPPLSAPFDGGHARMATSTCEEASFFERTAQNIIARRLSRPRSLSLSLRLSHAGVPNLLSLHNYLLFG